MRIFVKMFVIAALTFVAATSTARAAVITAATSPLNFNWSFDTGGTILDGTGSMTVSGFNSNTLTMLITLTNNADVGGQGGERLTAFGFGITPDATSVGFSDGADDGMVGAVLGGNFPAYKTVEVCAFGGQNCAGGGNGGIFGAGGTDTFTVTLVGTWGDSIDVAPIAFKYQTGYGSFEFDTGSGSGATGNLPEPGTSALLMLGVTALGAAVRRRRAR
jgi:hypothetical protein